MNSFGRHLDQPFHGGLTPSKLQRTTAYIQAHLEHALSLVELAAVTQTSPAHFAHLFKQATGQTPHQYVILCRMEEYRKNKATFHASPPASVSPSRARVPPGVPLSRPSPPAAGERRAANSIAISLTISTA